MSLEYILDGLEEPLATNLHRNSPPMKNADDPLDCSKLRYFRDGEIRSDGLFEGKNDVHLFYGVPARNGLRRVLQTKGALYFEDCAEDLIKCQCARDSAGDGVEGLWDAQIHPGHISAGAGS